MAVRADPLVNCPILQVSTRTLGTVGVIGTAIRAAEILGDVEPARCPGAITARSDDGDRLTKRLFQTALPTGDAVRR